MADTFRALCAELIDDLERCDWPYKLKDTIRADIDRARAALAEPEADGPSDPISELVSQCRPLEPEMAECLTPQARWRLYGDEALPVAEGPTVMEIIELADEIEAAELGQVDLVRAALARWGRPAAAPVPVSET